MLESAVGDIETLTRVIGVDALMAMRDAEREGRSPADFQGRITLVFDDESEADSVAVVGHAIATYVVGSAPRPAAPGLKTTLQHGVRVS